MKITSTATSTSLFDLIQTANSGAMALIEKKRIKNELMGGYGVELAFAGDEINVETVLDAATSDSRPVNADLPIFAFNCQDLHNIYLIGAGDIYVSIV